MKTKTTAILFLLILTAAISCKNDDDSTTDNPTNADLIVGTWDMADNTVTNGNADLTVQGIPINTDFTWTGSNMDYQLTFGDDNMVSENGSFDLNVIATVLGQPFNRTLNVATSTMADVIASGDYTVAGDQLMAQNNGMPVTASIMELTDTTLKLSLDLTQASPGEFDVSGSATGTNIITFTRQ